MILLIHLTIVTDKMLNKAGLRIVMKYFNVIAINTIHMLTISKFLPLLCLFQSFKFICLADDFDISNFICPKT